MLMAALGIGFVLVNAALTKPGKEPPVDHMLNVGSCVDIMQNGDATEVQCGAAHDGVVTEMLPANSVCDGGAELRHDHQGLGDVCVQRSSTG